MIKIMKQETINIENLNYEELEVIDIVDNENETMDIEVENDHYYTLSNGIVSHNTVALMTQTTSGIEPLFMPFYKRRRKVNPSDKNVVITFVDNVGDSWEEYFVIHDKFKVWMEINGHNSVSVDETELNELFKLSPYYGATSSSVDWLENVRMQGAINQYVDHSISKTINLPESATEKLVDELYRTAHEVGCKGITIYRENSRAGVLVASDKDKDKKEKDNKDKTVNQIVKENNAPKRPKVLDCDVIRFTNNGEKWIGFVGLLGGTPYELFTGAAESFEIPIYVEKGKIVKIKGGEKDGLTRYDFEYADKDGYKTVKEGLNRSFNPLYWNTTKLISGLLRHGMPIPSVVSLIDTLQLDGDHITTWKAGVKRMLKKYIKDGAVSNDKKCPECGEYTLVYEGGCVICKNEKCGSSKCG
jgi:ribonucleoside-diphosphate reductase alpha chain